MASAPHVCLRLPCEGVSLTHLLPKYFGDLPREARESRAVVGGELGRHSYPMAHPGSVSRPLRHSLMLGEELSTGYPMPMTLGHRLGHPSLCWTDLYIAFP